MKRKHESRAQRRFHPTLSESVVATGSKFSKSNTHGLEVLQSYKTYTDIFFAMIYLESSGLSLTKIEIACDLSGCCSHPIVKLIFMYFKAKRDNMKPLTQV